LYLEWAPTGIFSEKKKQEEEPEGKKTKQELEAILEDEQEQEGPGFTIFLKNLNFATVEETIQNAFKVSFQREIGLAQNLRTFLRKSLLNPPP